MSLFRFSGPDPTLYPYLQVADGQYAPFTLTDGDVVDLVAAPEDSRFTAVDDAGDVEPRLPDNHPDVIAAANEAASVTARTASAVADGELSLDQLKKADLIDLAEARGLDTSGTKADLIARLQEPEQPATAHDALHDLTDQPDELEAAPTPDEQAEPAATSQE